MPDDPAVLWTEAAAWAPAVDALRRGAHCTDATPNRFFLTDPGQVPADCDLVCCHQLLWMVVYQCRALLAAGDSGLAMELLLDALTLATDYVRSPVHRFIGCGLVSIATHGCEEEWLQQCGPGALRLLAGGLDRLDALPPPHLATEDCLLRRALWELEELPSPHGHLVDLPWQFLFSKRWMTADAILQMADWTERARDSTWLQRRREREQWSLSPSNVPMPMVDCEQQQRLAMAQMRVLWLCVEHRLGRQPTALEDPLADAPIAVEATAAGIRVTCGGGIEKHPLTRTTANLR
jgi:hypothetical protein